MAAPTNTVSIIPNFIKIRSAGTMEEKNYLRDGDFPGGQSYRDFIRGFLKSIRTAHLLVERNAGIRVDTVVAAEPEKLYGILKAGKYGFEAILENIETKATKTRDLKDCEYIPFFYLFEFKDNQASAILLMEQFGPYSARTSFMDLLRKHIADTLPGHVLEHGTLVDTDYVKDSVKENIKAFRFIWHTIPADVADDIFDEDAQEDEGKMELAFKPKNGGSWGRPSWFNWEDTHTRGLKITSTPYDEMKVDVEIKGKKKTIRVEQLSCFKMSFDVTSSVRIGKDGHPTAASMLNESGDIIDMAKRILGWEKK